MTLFGQDRCETCKFWFETTRPGQEKNGICRRNPPQMVVVPTPNGLQVLGHFPGMTAEGWCGEWQPKLSMN